MDVQHRLRPTLLLPPSGFVVLVARVPVAGIAARQSLSLPVAVGCELTDGTRIRDIKARKPALPLGSTNAFVAMHS
jgi:hypothetical protein